MKLLQIAEGTFIAEHAIASIQVFTNPPLPTKDSRSSDCKQREQDLDAFRLTIRLLDGRTFDRSGASARPVYGVLERAVSEARCLSYQDAYQTAHFDYQGRRCPFCGALYDVQWQRCLRCDWINLFRTSPATFHSCFTRNQTLTALLPKLDDGEVGHLHAMLDYASRFQNDRNA